MINDIFTKFIYNLSKTRNEKIFGIERFESADHNRFL